MNRKWLLVGALVLAMILFMSSSRPGRIRYIANELPQHPDRRYSKRPLSRIKRTIIHHSGGPAGQSIYDIANYHISPNHICDEGCPGISYTFIIDPQARIYQTQPLDIVSYHTGGLNEEGVSICLLGNYNELELSPAVVRAINYTIRYIERKTANEQIVGLHRDHRDTNCPGANVDLARINPRLAA